MPLVFEQNRFTMISVDVIYALPENPIIKTAEIMVGDTVLGAIAASGILSAHPIDISAHFFGIYGRVVSLNDTVAAGDRVEIYRPLLADPKTIRLKRAKKRK